MEEAALKYQKRIHAMLMWYGVYLIVTLIMTLYMGTRANVLTTSMSAMGNLGTTIHWFFIAWTIVFCTYFTSTIGLIQIMTQNTKSRLRVFVDIAVGIMIFGDIVPFLPHAEPFLAWVHNVCAQISSVSLGFSLLLLTLTIRRAYPDVFRKALNWVFVIWGSLLGLMALFGTKAITEMTGIMGGSIFLYVFAWWIAKARSFNASVALSAHDANEADEKATRLEKKANELHEQYLEARAEARQARLAADELYKAEVRIRKKQGTSM